MNKQKEMRQIRSIGYEIVRTPNRILQHRHCLLIFLQRINPVLIRCIAECRDRFHRML